MTVTNRGWLVAAVAAALVISGLVVAWARLVDLVVATGEYHLAILVTDGWSVAVTLAVSVVALVLGVRHRDWPPRLRPRYRAFGTLAVIAGAGALVFWGSQVVLDLVGRPAVVQGAVTDRYISHSQRGHVPSYHLVITSHDYEVTSAVYGQTARPGCYVLTYAPHVGLGTSAASCPSQAPARMANGRAHIDAPVQFDLRGGICLLDRATVSGEFPAPGRVSGVLWFALGKDADRLAGGHGISYRGIATQPYHGPGTYPNTIVSLSNAEVQTFGLASVVINQDRTTGLFRMNDGSASGSFSCGDPLT